VRIRPARRIDLLARFAGAFDLVEDQPAGHAARVAYLAHQVGTDLQLGSESLTRILYAGLLHDSGAGLPFETSRAEASAWVVSQFGLDAQVVEAVRAISERWDGRGAPAGLSATDIPVEALCVSAAHWVCDYADHVDHPLRARASLQRADRSELVPLVGSEVAVALRNVLNDDETWLAVFGEDLPGMVARLGMNDEKPSRKVVDETVDALGTVIDAAFREPGRAVRVATLARALGALMGLSEAACEGLAIAGRILDIGQLGVPPQILDKPSILTVDEMELMRRHPGVGARLLETVPGFEDITTWVEQHHERPDGRGYPEMLSDDELPLPPRILSVADAYWALRAERPYRSAHGPDEALEILRVSAGRQFDRDVVEALPGALDVVAEVLGEGVVGEADAAG
jgi:HD-GYP domain-containing protein (c-di-GMP phosphodiesterase class II)